MKLNQIIAIEKTAKSEHQSAITQLHRLSKHAELFNGFAKRYTPKDEDGEKYPDERQVVQHRVDDNLTAAFDSLAELADIVATKDWGNTVAQADVVVDGNVLMPGVPATHLLYWEKLLNDVRTFVEQLPEMDPSEAWKYDGTSGLHQTAEIKTQRMAKVQEPIVLYDATPEHPAQTQIVTKDVVVGYWHTVKLTGAIPAERKRAILRRVSELQRAVKIARETANGTDVEKKKVAETVVRYILEGN